MTPQEALQLLDQAAAQATLSRQDHVKVQQAAQVLKNLITANAEDAEDE